MCGIAGILSADGGASSCAPALERMRRAIRHRGPDDDGSWTSPSGEALLSHTRLAIIDLSSGGHQPMSTREGRYTITFNGEIYNYRELRLSLEQRGAEFRTKSDTEVILKAYEADGPAAIAALRGMFAFAIWDEQERVCLLARDRCGIKPFYYQAAGNRLIFASEVQALVASGLVDTAIDADGLYGYFRTGSVPEPSTLLRGVSTLEAGSFAVWKDGAISVSRYWDLSFAQARTPGDDDVAAARAALDDSVRHHFISDAPVGVFLSGGIDSTALVAVAARSQQHQIHTFSLTFPGLSNDEGELARRTADHFGTTHIERPLDAQSGLKLFEQFLRHSDLPSIDGMNTFAVAKLARECGMKVVLSGVGADELFAGYPSFDEVPTIATWNMRLSHAGPVRRGLGRAIERFSLNARGRRIGDLLAQEPTVENAYMMYRAVFTRREARALVAHFTSDASFQESAPTSMPFPGGDPTVRDTISRLEFSRYMRNQLLRDGDVMSMASGLELRVPFLDGEFIDTMAMVPARTRLQPGKQFLQRMVPEIPQWVTRQPKRGFSFPFENWLKAEWRERFADIRSTMPVAADTWYRQWCVFVLDRWIKNLKRTAS